MSSTYSPNLAIELIGTGDQAGNWGSTTNTNLGTLIEQAISGYTSQAINGTDVTLSMTQGASCTARNMYIVLTGSGGANLIVPNNIKLYFISNTASTAITVKTSAGTGISVPVSAKICLLCDGTNVVVAENYMVSATLPNATLSSPTMTGTPVAPTAAVGTNTTQIATTAFVTAGIQAAYPVGSIYVSTVSTNPNTLFGFGTWVAYGQGRMLISQDGTYTAGSTGGSATTTLITANLPSHSHSATTTSTDSGHTHGSAIGSGFISNGGPESLAGGPNLPFGRPSATASGNAIITSTTTIGNTGSGTAVTTISPYIAVYMWNRTV
jgi:microcystin-dependent protein